MDAARFSAIVCDPPYGLEFMGSEWDAPWKREITEHPNGVTAPRFASTRNPVCRECRRMKRGADACACAEPSFDEVPADEGRAFQAWCETWALEAFRVLKPGGFLLAFGGTRTHHRLACALEDVGFELRDEVQWWYGQGFPKSLNVSEAIDKAAGATREVIGVKHAERYPNGPGGNSFSVGEDPDGTRGPPPLTAPATPEAAAWDGWGTALKPALEPVIVARKPLVGTVAANVLRHGTGAINIGGSRIEASGRPLRESLGEDTEGKNTYGANGPGGGSRAVGVTDVGRWPANLILSHSPDCEVVGTAVVKNDGHFPNGSEPSAFQGKGFEGREGWQVGDEVVEVYDCVPGCPVAELDGQTGELKAGGALRGNEPSSPFGGPVYGEMVRDGRAWAGYGDRGGASRFFYCAKTTRAERDAGLGEDFEMRPLSWSSGEANPGAFQSDGTEKTAKNDHPTVKPIDVMRWLLRLVTPPGGEVLDPFAGSGSTLCAAAVEGVEITGIEQNPDYVRIAEARLAFWTEHGDRGFEVCRSIDASRRRRRRVSDAGQLDLLAGA